jgi:ribosome recycling factor
MDQSIEAFKNNLTKIRTGRANPALLDTIHVEYYGSMVPLSQVANVALLDARTISVQPWEKGMGAKIEKAIRERSGPEPGQHGRPDPRAHAAHERRAPQGDDQGGAPGRRAGQDRHPQPAPRRQRRHEEAGQGQEATEDEQKRSEAEIQKVTDKHVAEIDALVAGKERTSWRSDGAPPESPAAPSSLALRLEGDNASGRAKPAPRRSAWPAPRPLDVRSDLMLPWRKLLHLLPLFPTTSPS